MAPHKKNKPHKKKTRRAAPLVLDFQIRGALAEAESHAKREDWSAARLALEALRLRAPTNLGVLVRLGYVSFKQQDWLRCAEVSEYLIARLPERDELYLALSMACMQAEMSFSAARTLRAFCARFPEHPELATAQQDLEMALRMCSEQLAMRRERDRFPLDGEAAAQFLAGYERMLMLLNTGRNREALEQGQALQQQLPDWPPLLTQLSLALGFFGRYEEALAHLERALALQPDNPLALLERVKRLFLLGRTAEARQAAEAAPQSSEKDEAEVRLAEALALLGDDRGVLGAYRRAQEAGRPQDPEWAARLYSLAATAEMRLGDEAAARALWQKALEQRPGFAMAQQHLVDLDRPPGERHGPWYLEASRYFHQSWLYEFTDDIERLKGDKALHVRARQTIDKHPELLALLPALLDRGDEDGWIFALKVCQLAQTPQTFSMAYRFMLGKRGPDKLRLEMLSSFAKEGLVPQRPLLMWLKGQWTQIDPLGLQIGDEPQDRHGTQEQGLSAESSAGH